MNTHINTHVYVPNNTTNEKKEINQCLAINTDYCLYGNSIAPRIQPKLMVHCIDSGSRSIARNESSLQIRNIISMILATFTRQSLDSNHKQADYQWFDNLNSFVDWYKNQGDKLVYSLRAGKKSLTQNGFVTFIESPASILQVTDTTLRIHTEVEKLISDEGLIFNNIQHSSQQLVNCMLLKCVLK